MNRYDISVKVEGYEYYTVEAESEEEAFKLIKDGDGYLQCTETEWSDDFHVDCVIELDEDEEELIKCCVVSELKEDK